MNIQRRAGRFETKLRKKLNESRVNYSSPLAVPTRFCSALRGGSRSRGEVRAGKALQPPRVGSSLGYLPPDRCSLDLADTTGALLELHTP